MNRRKLALLVAAVAVAAIAWPAAAVAQRATTPPAPTASTTYTDSTGEDASAPDISTVVVSNDSAGTVTFQVNIANRPALTNDMLIAVLVDSDGNPATGNTGLGGADYAIVMVAGGVQMAHWNGSDFDFSVPQSSLSYSYAATGATIRIAAADLGNTTAFNFSVLAVSGITNDSSGNPDMTNAHRDLAPDPGHGMWSYQVKTQPAALSVVKFATVPLQPVAGRPFAALLAVGRSDGAPLAAPQVSCTATIDGKPLAAKAQTVANGVAVCAWTLPRNARGKTIRGSVTVSSQGLTASRSFTARIR